MFGGWMSLRQIKMLHSTRLLLRLAQLREADILVRAVLSFFLSQIIYVNQIKHVLCCMYSSTEMKWKAAIALLSMARPQCLLFVCSCLCIYTCFVINMQVQGLIFKWYFWAEDNFLVLPIEFVCEEMFPNVCELYWSCILNDVQSNLASPVSSWGIGVGNSPQISFIFGTQIAYLKQEEKRTQTSKTLTPTLTSLRPKCFLESALKRLT